MPFYDFIHKEGKNHCKTVTEFRSFEQYDSMDFPYCSCGAVMVPVGANNVCVYGTDRYSDDTLKDASLAAGFKITNTKQVDKLEREGKMYRVTNPSTYRNKNDKNKAARERAYKEKMRRAF